MKRITPQQRYGDDAGYPPATEPRLSRRGFLRRALSTAAAGAGALAGASPSEAAPAPRTSAPRRIRINLPYQSPVAGTNLRPERVEVFTADPRVARLLEDSKERGGIQQAVTRITRTTTAADLFDGARLYRLEQRIAAALRTHLRRRSGKPLPALDLMLLVGSGYRIRTGGVMIRPSRPHPHPRRP